MLSRHQLVPADSPAAVHVDADATAAAQTHAAPGIQSPFLREQPAEPQSETPVARPSSGRLFPDTAKGHMAMVRCFTVAVQHVMLDDSHNASTTCIHALHLVYFMS